MASEFRVCFFGPQATCSEVRCFSESEHGSYVPSLHTNPKPKAETISLEQNMILFGFP